MRNVNQIYDCLMVAICNLPKPQLDRESRAGKVKLNGKTFTGKKLIFTFH